MELSQKPLTSANLDEVFSFFKLASPFAQKAWGWDAGRFVDWRWGANSVRHGANSDWFSEHCHVFRQGDAIRAVSVAESGREVECIVTPREDIGAVTETLGWLTEHHAEAGIGLSFDVSESARWLKTILGTSGLVEEAVTEVAWEYALGDVPQDSAVAPGFLIESLGSDREGDYPGIAECIQSAFNSKHDVHGALLSLEANPLFVPELSVIARSPTGRIAAYCRGTVDRETGVASIDPVCCHPEFQRKGLAKAVVQQCFRTQRDLGGQFSYIGSAPEPAPGTFLYRSLTPNDMTLYHRWKRP